MYDELLLSCSSNIASQVLASDSLILMYLWAGLWVCPTWISWSFSDMQVVFHQFQEAFSLYLFKNSALSRSPFLLELLLRAYWHLWCCPTGLCSIFFVSPFCSLDCMFQFFAFAYSFFCLKHHSVILFSSLDMVFFNSLSKLIIAHLKSLSRTKIQSLGFLRHSFSWFLFSCVYTILCFFTCLVFLLNTRCFEYSKVELWKYQICCCCLL